MEELWDIIKQSKTYGLSKQNFAWEKMKAIHPTFCMFYISKNYISQA